MSILSATHRALTNHQSFNSAIKLLQGGLYTGMIFLLETLQQRHINSNVGTLFINATTTYISQEFMHIFEFESVGKSFQCALAIIFRTILHSILRYNRVGRHGGRYRVYMRTRAGISESYSYAYTMQAI